MRSSPILSENTVDGYVWIKVEESPPKWVRRARFVMEQHLGRTLKRTEIVHHMDGDRSNDSLTNLKVTSQSEHILLHEHCWNGSSQKIVPPSPDLAWCSDCKQFLSRDKFYNNHRHWNGLTNQCKSCQGLRTRRRTQNARQLKTS